MAKLDRADLQAAADAVAPGKATIGIKSRQETAWVRVHPNRLMIALVGGAAPNSAVEVQTLDGETARVILPEPEQLQLTSPAQIVALADDSDPPGPIMVEVETFEIVIDGVRTEADALDGKGSAHKRTPRPRAELRALVRHCLGTVALERTRQRVSEHNPDLDDDRHDDLLAISVACGTLTAAKRDELRQARRASRGARRR